MRDKASDIHLNSKLNSLEDFLKIRGFPVSNYVDKRIDVRKRFAGSPRARICLRVNRIL